MQAPNAPLSRREREVLLLMADGHQNQAIADKLCKSTHTIKNHKTNACQKLNLTSTAELLCYATKNAIMLQNGGGKLDIGRFPIFGFWSKNRKSSYCL